MGGKTYADQWYFKLGVNLAIMANAVQLGLSVELKGDQWAAVWDSCDHVFTSIFLLEMILKVAALKKSYFQSNWNLVDFLLAWLGVADTWILPWISSTNEVLKLFRLLRLMRMAKLLRTKRELHVLL